LPDLQGWHFAHSVIGANDNLLGVGIVLYVHFLKLDATFFQKGFGAPAIGAPTCAVDRNRFHAWKNVR